MGLEEGGLDMAAVSGDDDVGCCELKVVFGWVLAKGRLC